MDFLNDIEKDFYNNRVEIASGKLKPLNNKQLMLTFRKGRKNIKEYRNMFEKTPTSCFR